MRMDILPSGEIFSVHSDVESRITLEISGYVQNQGSSRNWLGPELEILESLSDENNIPSCGSQD